MIYFDFDMSKSTNTVVYFDWKTAIYIYACGKCRTQFMLPMEKSVTFTGACANEIIPSINHSFVCKAKEGRHVWISNKALTGLNWFYWPNPPLLEKRKRHCKCCKYVSKMSPSHIIGLEALLKKNRMYFYSIQVRSSFLIQVSCMVYTIKKL